jgi:hypothetical protein
MVLSNFVHISLCMAKKLAEIQIGITWKHETETECYSS